MQTLKERKSLLIKILAVVLLVLLCRNLPSLMLCLKQDFFRPPNTKVLVSACKSPKVFGVPGGEVAFVREGFTDKMYLLDLRTGEKRDVPNDPLLLKRKVFLSSNLVWVIGSPGGPSHPSYRPHYILDLTNGNRYELLDLTWLPLKDGAFDPKYYEYIKSANQVFLHHGENIVIALSLDLSQGKNVVLFKSLGTGKNGEKLNQILSDLDVNYEIIDFSLYNADVPSPTNKYIARFDGIYLARTNQRITSGMYNYFRGWYYDDSAIIVQGNGDYLLTFPGVSSVFYVPSPVLKLRLPTP